VDLNTRGAEQVQAALAAGPSPEAKDDLMFLATLFHVYQPLLQALRDYHSVRAEEGGRDPHDLLRAARQNAQEAAIRASRAFPQPVDPVMGEIRSLRTFPRQLAEAIGSWEKAE